MFCCQDSCGFPAQCVSIPAHLLAFCRSNPNPAKGFGASCPRKGFTVLVSQGPIRLAMCYEGSYVSIVQTAARGKKPDGFMLGGFMMSIKGRLRRRHPAWMKKTLTQVRTRTHTVGLESGLNMSLFPTLFCLVVYDIYIKDMFI